MKMYLYKDKVSVFLVGSFMGISLSRQQSINWTDFCLKVLGTPKCPSVLKDLCFKKSSLLRYLIL